MTRSSKEEERLRLEALLKRIARRCEREQAKKQAK